MPPLPYPHRVSFLASALVMPPSFEHLDLLAAKLLAAVLFDHLIRHPMVTLGDFDDERLTDDDNRLLDARHADVEDTIDWFFRIDRRHEVLWLDLGLDAERPEPVRLFARRSGGGIDEWSSGQGELSAQIGQCLDQWLDARHLPRASVIERFSLADFIGVVERLDRALLSTRPDNGIVQPVAPELLAPPSRLAVAFYRVMADMSSLDPHDFDLAILRLDPSHPVARRNVYLHKLRHGSGDPRALLALVHEAPMYGKPHLSLSGDAFDDDRPDEGLGLRHQGIAASLLPADPYACHNYSLQLADAYRREESYRWSDRATIGSPGFNTAHLDCVRRLRQIGRPGQAFAEAQYRCHDILDRAGDDAGGAERAARRHAGMLLALVHHDVGRLDEAIRIADEALADLGDTVDDGFGWAVKRLRDWKTDPVVLAQSYAWEGYHRGDPGRTIVGFARSRVDDADDVAMLLDALITVGREDLARVAVHHYSGVDGIGILGDGKARLRAAQIEIMLGDPSTGIDHLQIVQLRRSQSRLEAEINRLLRLACVRKPSEWEAVIARRHDQGARRLARMAARDLADFVPGLDTPGIARALGDRLRFEVDPAWLAALRAALPALGGHADAIDRRLAMPAESSLTAADRLAQDWWTALVPPAKDRDAHAAAAVYALGIALARYLALASGSPTPLSGGYRHIATEALHLVRRARYQIDEAAARGLLELAEHCAERMARDEWLVDTWLLRIERALDLDTEQGSYLPGLIAGLRKVEGLLRGDERIGWELRLAFDLRDDPSQLDATRMLFERCQRAMETGAAAVAWSDAAAISLPHDQAIDVHWLAATANPYHGSAWLNLARSQFALGRPREAFESLCHGFAPTGDDWRKQQLATLDAAWQASGLDVPIGFDAAHARAIDAVGRGDFEVALRCLRWCEALEPSHGAVKRMLGVVQAKLGRVHDAVRSMAGHDKVDAAKLVGHALLEAHKYAEAVLAYRYASLRFVSDDDWHLLAVAAWYAENDDMAAVAYQRMLAAGAPADNQTLHGLATALYNTGQWQLCEQVAQQLIRVAGTDPTYRSCGLHALAKALCGQGRFAEAVPVAEQAARLNPLPDNARDMADTLQCAQLGQVPLHEAGRETSIERQAFAALEAGELALPEQLAAQGNSWGLFRAALAATEFRHDADIHHPVAARALEAAQMVLERTIGNPLIDAVLCRIRALHLRENAFIQIDPLPPLGTRLTGDELDRELAARTQAAAAPTAATADASPSDPVIFPGQKVARLSDYVAITKRVQAGDMNALARAGLDLHAYRQIASMWGQKLAADALLNARFTAMMQR